MSNNAGASPEYPRSQLFYSPSGALNETQPQSDSAQGCGMGTQPNGRAWQGSTDENPAGGTVPGDLPYKPLGNYFGVPANSGCVNPPTQSVAVDQEVSVEAQGQAIVTTTGTKDGLPGTQTTSVSGTVAGTNCTIKNPA